VNIFGRFHTKIDPSSSSKSW